MSDTPRTDDKEFLHESMAWVIPSDFARELERENARLRELLREVAGSKYLSGVEWPEVESFLLPNVV
jgi:hypothetical protein